MRDNSRFLEHKEQVERSMHQVWTPHSGQVDIAYEFFYNWIQGIFMRCGRKYGKTELAIYCMYLFGKLFANSECYYVADEKDHARDICWDNRRLPEFLASFRANSGEEFHDYQERKRIGGNLHENWVRKVNESEMYVRLDNGSMLKVDGAKNWKKADGLGPVFVVYDEFKNHDPRYDRASRPNLMDLNGRILIIGTPPDNEDNYYCETEEEFKHKPNHKTYIRPSWTNPHVYSGPNDKKLAVEREALERKGELHVYLREYECQIVPDSKKQIFPMFKRPTISQSHTKHVRPHDELMSIYRNRPRDFDLYVCYDAGSAAAFAVLLCAINRHTKQILWLGEVYETEQARMTTRTIYDQSLDLQNEIHEYRPDWYEIYDNAALWFANEVHDHYEDACLYPCSKDVKKKEAKLSFMKDIMLEPDLWLVSDRCPNFIKETADYSKDDNGRIKKEKDHALDCFSGDTLISTINGPVRIDEISVGDIVYTDRGLDEVVDSWTSGTRDVIRVEMDNGESVVCTPDHRFYTINRGFICADLLTDDDMLYTIHRNGGFVWRVRALFIMVLSLLDTQRARIEQIGCTTDVILDTIRRVFGICTGMFTSRRLELFLLVIISIILMTISLIMTPLTLSVYLLRIMLSIIMLTIAAIEKEKTLKELGIFQKHGILAKKVKSGIARTLKKCGKICLWLIRYASSAQKTIRLKSHYLVKASIVTRIVSKKQELEGCEVYDITTKNHNRFFASSVLVHNCSRYILNESRYDVLFKEYKREKNKENAPRFFTPEQDILKEKKIWKPSDYRG